MATDEIEAALAAALLHDIGHGPFSHTLEHELIPAGKEGSPHHHEHMSRALIARINKSLHGRLDLALAIFDGTYERPFFHTLLASQLDMDRLDYLRRDSFYTGVAEGVVGVERILKTLRVHPTAGGPNARVVIEAKGAYAVESFILSRRLMYWQVYLHKTVIAADHLLRAAFARARVVWARDGTRDPALAATAPALAFFLQGRATSTTVTGPDAPLKEEALDAFVLLDDTDVLYSLKRWVAAADPLLSDLARRFVDRDLFRTLYLPTPPTASQLTVWRGRVANWLVDKGLSSTDEALAAASLYVSEGVARLDAYRLKGDPISILERDGRLRELSEARDVEAVGALAGVVEKPYVCYPKSVDLALDA